MTITTVPLDDAPAWRAALEGIPHAYPHTWEHCRAMAQGGGQPTVLALFDDGAGRAVCPVAERGDPPDLELATPYGMAGFVGRGSLGGLPAAWRQFTATRGHVCGYIGLGPLFDVAAPLFADDCVQVHTVYVADLARSVDELTRALGHGARGEIKQWDRRGAALEWDRPTLRGAIAALYPDFLARVGASRVYDFPPATFDQLFADERVVAVGVRDAGMVEAVTLFGHSAHAGEYLFNVSSPAGRVHSTALAWHGMLALRERGVPVVNLGGGIKPDDGLARFKARLGGVARPLRALKQIYDKPRFDTLCRAANVSSESTGYFPPYRDPGLRA